MATPTKGLTSARRNRHPQDTPWATRKGQGPQSPPFRKNIQRSILFLRRLRGYTHWVCSRAPARKLKKPPKECSTPPRAWELHPPCALVHTHWQVKKSPNQFYSNRPGARGLLSRTNTRVPEKEELITININSSKQSRALLQLQLTPRCVSSASPGLWGRAPPRPTPRPL